MGIFEAIRRRKRNPSGAAIVAKTQTRQGLLLETESDTRVNLFLNYRKAYDSVPLIKAIIDVQADQTAQEFFFEGPNSKKLTKWADEVNLQQFFHRTAKMMLLYGNSYTEVVRDGDKVTEMKILDPTWVDVHRSPVGKLLGYSQIIKSKKLLLWGSTGAKRIDDQFKKRIMNFDSIVHFPHNLIGADKYGTSILRPMLQAINIKHDMENNLQKILFKFAAPLIWAKVGSNEFPASETHVDDVSNTIRDLQAESEITTTHLVDLGVLDFNSKGIDLQTPVNHVEQQIITGGQVPPVLLGRSENVDQASAEVQLRNFGRHIKAIQRELKNIFEDVIITKYNLGTEEDKLVWVQAEEREREIEIDILRGLVTDGILTPQKANDLLPPRFRETLPEINDPLNQQAVGQGGLQVPRASQGSPDKIKDNPNDPTKTTKNARTKGKRRPKSDREDKRDNNK